MDLAMIVHYGIISFIVGMTTLGVGLGSAKASVAALEAINRQPSVKNNITRATIIGLALIETAAILALIIVFLSLPKTVNFNQSLAELALALALGIPGFIVGYVSCYPLIETYYALARQPFFGQKIINFMLIMQSIIQTPLIFGFLIALLIVAQISSVQTIPQALILCASGLSIGIGCIGPLIGLSKFSQMACKTLGMYKNAYSYVIPFSFMSQAIIETPLIFSLLIALILATKGVATASLMQAVQALCAALCIAIGTFSPGISSSKTACQACFQIAKNPEQYRTISQVSLFAQGLIDAASVYALLVALFLVLLT